MDIFKKDVPRPDMRDIAGESNRFKQYIDPNYRDPDVNLPYSGLTKDILDSDLYTSTGSLSDISPFNMFFKNVLGIDTPTTNSIYNMGMFKGKTPAQIEAELVSDVANFQTDKYNRLKLFNLISRTDGGELGSFEDFKKNPELYQVNRDINERIREREDQEKALTIVGKEMTDKEKNNFLSGLIGGNTGVKKGDPIEIAEDVFGAPSILTDSNTGTLSIKATPDNYKEFEQQIRLFQPDLLNRYETAKDSFKNAKNLQEAEMFGGNMRRLENQLFNPDGTITLMDNMFEDHQNIIKDAIANGSLSYAGGSLTQLGIEFIPGIGFFGLGGVKKAGQAAAKIIYNGKEIALSFVPGTARLNAKTKDLLSKNGVPTKAINLIEVKNAESIVGKLKFNEKTGKMEMTNPNIANMSKSGKFDDVPNIDAAIAAVKKEAAENGEILTNKEATDLAIKRSTFGIKSDKAGKELENMFGKEAADYGLEMDLIPSPYEKALEKSKTPWQTKEHKKIYDKLDSLEEGTEINVSALAKELDKPRASITKIMKEYYPDLKILNPGQAAKKAIDATLDAKRADALETSVDVPTVVVQAGTDRKTKGYTVEDVIVKWPSDEIEEKYIADFIKKHNIPKGSSKQPITNAYLAKTYLGGDSAKNIATVEKINHELKKQFPDLTYALSEGRDTIYYTSTVLKNSPFGRQVYGNASKFLKDKMYYTKINRNGKEVKVTELHKGHPLQKDYFENPNFPEEFIDFVNRPTFYTTQKRNTVLHKELENKLIPLINKNDKLKTTLHDLGTAKKTNTQKFNRTKKEIKELEDQIDKIANELNESGLVVMYPSFGKLKQYGKPYDNLMQLYQDYKTKKSRGEAIFKEGGEVRKGFATGTRDGALVGDDITGNTIYGQYLTNLNLTMDKRLRDQDNMDRILEAPKSMQRAVAMTLYDEDEAAFLEEIRQMPSSVRAEFKQKILEAKEIQKSLAETLRDERPVKFPIKSVPKLLTDNVIFKGLLKRQMMPTIVFKNFFDDLIGREGPENAEKIAPNVNKYLNLGPTPATPPEQAYIDGIDEFNRALETGVTNIGFSIMDLILGGVDLATKNNFALTEKLQKLYDEKGINEPETFLGDMTALLVEFGVPGGLVSKLLTRAQKAMRLNGINTMTRYLDPDLTGSARRAIQFTNLASRVGTGTVVFGATDFIAGGPNNSLKRMFPDDSTLLPGKPERTDDLTGSELVKANFRNRLRFAADGALIGAGFPLIGPPLLGIVKGTAKLPFKTIPGIDRSVVGGTLQLAGVPIRIAADVLAGKIPYTQKMIPAVGKTISKTGEKTASAVQATAAFVGKNVFARAALAAQDMVFARDAIYSGINRGTTFARGIPKVFGGEGGGLPSFQEWRKFSVNSSDPLHANLARIDNKLALFRDIGKLTKDAFALSTKSQNFIKSKSRTIDKLYTNLEQITYRLAKKFEEQHKKWGQFDVIQKKYLDDVLDYLKGNKKIENIDPPLRDAALELKEYYRKLMTEFKDLLPDGDKLKTLLTQDIDSQMKRSFAAFTNANFRPGAENVKAARDYIANFIKQDTSLQADAKLAFPNAKSLDEAINSLAELKVADLMHVARYEMEDPIRAFKKIAGKLETAGVKGVVDPLEIFTGQELPKVIRQLMGEEKSLKNSLMQTTGNVIASTQQKQALDRIAKLGLENRWLFNTQKEALDIGKINDAIPVGDIKGAGFLPSDILGLYGSPEIVKQLSGYSIFDSALKYKIYQNLLAFKAMVQGGKTLYSPATQMRNFGSASLFAMNVGHIGGKTSVTQNFKIMLDDIFGSGPGVNQSDLIKFIERKIELGVLDENVVAQELGGVLRDLKGVVGADGKPVISNFNRLTQRVGDSKISQTVQRLYAGGDNVWKAYGHEFYMSELKQFTKSLDDVSNFFRTQVGREWEPMKNGVKKTLAEGIEEMAAHLLRETYPTYSRVPPAIQALRKLPLGNFISFPAEMIRTSLATTASSMKMIGSGNPGLQAMGYRALMGQFTTLYGFNHGAQKLASKMTGIGEDKLRAYQDDLGPSFIDDHILIPITKQQEDGTFKVFDASTYNPYNYLVGPVEEFIRQLTSTRLDPAQVDTELDRRFFDTVGPFMKLLEPFIGETIALEPVLDIYARNGITRDGRQIFSPSDSPSDKREKSIYHAFETIAPGFVRSASQIYGALQLDTKAGRVMELGDVLIRLMGGSIMEVDPVEALDYKAIDIREIRGAAFKTEHFFSKDNALSRGPILNERGRKVGHVMANEFRDIQEEAFVAQFGIWKMFHKALASGLLTEDQIESVLGSDGRNVPNLSNLMEGEFTPVTFSESGLQKRADEIIEEYGKRGIIVNEDDVYPYFDLLNVIDEFEYRRFEDFLDPARPPLDEIPFDINSISQTPTPPTSDIPVAPLDTSDFADTQIVAAPKQTVVGANNQQVNNQTGLTRNEEALLSPSDQFYRRSQRGKV